MFLKNWLSTVQRRLRRQRNRSGRQRRNVRLPISSEILEQRTLPAVTPITFLQTEGNANADVGTRVYFSTDTPGSLTNPDGSIVAYDDSDVLEFTLDDDGLWTASMFFDGSDVGLTTDAEDIDAFAILSDGSLLISTLGAVSVSGVTNGRREDLLRFVPTSLGDDTSGMFSMYFDGSDVGLTLASENIDSVDVFDDGSLLISTTGNVIVPGVANGRREDVLLFAPETTGTNTRGTWQMLIDGSDVGLTTTSENIDNLAFEEDGGLALLMTKGAFSVPGASGDAQDVVGFEPSGSDFSFVFAGSEFPLGSANPDAFEFVVDDGEPPPTTTDDRFEENDSRAQAADLGPVSGMQTIPNLVMRDGQDWFRFQSNQPSSASISSSVYEGNLDLYVYDVNGNEVGSSTSGTNNERVSLSGLSGGTFYIQVQGWNGLVTSDYSLTLESGTLPPPPPPPVGEDRYEENDSRAQAADFGAVSGTQTISNLAMRDGQDWFRFQNSQPGSVSISSSVYDGDLDLYVFDVNGNEVGSSTSGTNNERVSLSGHSGGTFYVQVQGWNGLVTSDYSLTLDSGTLPPLPPPPPPPPPPPVGEDRYEENDLQAQAADLGAVSGTQTIPNLVMRDGQDWFRFQSNQPSSVSISSSVYEGDLDLYVYDVNGNEVGSSTSGTNNERVSLSGQSGGTFYVQVQGWNGLVTSDYSLTLESGTLPPPPPPPPPPVGEDRYEENDSRAQAADLGAVSGTQTISNLVMRDGQDWFRFQSNQPSSVSISSSVYEGDLDLYVFDVNGNEVGSSTSGTNNERVALSGHSGGTFYVQVQGWNGLVTSDYSLTLDSGTLPPPPPPPPPPPVRDGKTMYVNFDGATISATDLARWSGDWDINPLQSIDPERDGIRVTSFMAGDYRRDQIIDQIIQLLQQDLGTFDLTVRRHNGLAVENVGATTVFVGQDNISGQFAGVAGDVDWTNNNRTDITFVRQQSGGSADQIALVTADIILHEAGHSYGLYHVNSPYTNEAMGMGYSAGTGAGENAIYRNESFPEFIDQYGNRHGGGRGPQNSYQHMSSAFNGGLSSSMTTTYGAAPLHADDWGLGAIVFGSMEEHEHHCHENEFGHEHEHEFGHELDEASSLEVQVSRAADAIPTREDFWMPSEVEMTEVVTASAAISRPPSQFQTVDDSGNLVGRLEQWTALSSEVLWQSNQPPVEARPAATFDSIDIVMSDIGSLLSAI